MNDNKVKSNPEEIKKKIISLFNKKVRGKILDTSSSNTRHDGRGGHWLETQMGISHNANNAPDLWGFEMKNSTKNKTSFGDWSADYYIYNDDKYFSEKKMMDNRNQFITIQ